MAGKYILKDGVWISTNPHFPPPPKPFGIEVGKPPAGKVQNPAAGSNSSQIRDLKNFN